MESEKINGRSKLLRSFPYVWVGRPILLDLSLCHFRPIPHLCASAFTLSTSAAGLYVSLSRVAFPSPLLRSIQCISCRHGAGVQALDCSSRQRNNCVLALRGKIKRYYYLRPLNLIQEKAFKSIQVITKSGFKIEGIECRSPTQCHLLLRRKWLIFQHPLQWNPPLQR